MRISSWRRVVCAAVALLFGALDSPAQYGPGTVKVALTGDANPFGGILTFFNSNPVLTNDGLATFQASNNTGGSGLLQKTAAGVFRGLWTTTAAPNGGTLSSFDTFQVSSAGQIALLSQSIVAATSAETGPHIYLAPAPGLVSIALKGGKTPTGGTFVSFGGLSINAAGQIAFHGISNGGANDGIYLGAHGVPTPASIAAINGAVSNGSTLHLLKNAVALNDSGDVAFRADTVGGPPNANNIDNIYVRTATGLHTIASSELSDDFMFNNLGQVAFRRQTGTNSTRLLSRGTVSATSTIVSSGDSAPGGGTFSSIGHLVFNQSGEIAFVGMTDNGPGAGIYLSTATGLKSIALAGPAPDGGAFSFFLDNPVLNNHSQVAFLADLGFSDRRIYMGDSSGLLKVIGIGDQITGPDKKTWTVSEVALAPQAAPGQGPLNDKGQLAYLATYQIGETATTRSGIFIFTPSLHWRLAGSGSWDTAANWSFNIPPAQVHNVAIDPATSLTVTGPAANVAVHSLTVGSGAGTATLTLQTAALLTTTTGVIVGSHGRLSGAGTIAGNLSLEDGSEVALKLAGPQRGTGYDFIKATGKLTFGGTLNVTFANNYTPAPGDSFDLFDFAVRVGTFKTVKLPALIPAGLTWNTAQLYTTGKISVSRTTFFSTHTGSYSGLLLASTAGKEPLGSVLLTVKADGTFTGTVHFEGKSYPASGLLDLFGFKIIKFGVPENQLGLQLDLTHPTDQITGDLTSDNLVVARLTSDRNTVAPDPALVGNYTVALPPDPAQQANSQYPHGNGYATLNVSARGVVRLLGALGDTTAFSQSGLLTGKGQFPIYIPLYGAKGSLAGMLTLHGSSAADKVDGILTWSKPVTLTPNWYPDAISGKLVVEGSGYQAPPAHPKVLDLPNGQGTFTVSAGDIGVVPPRSITIDALNRVTSTTKPFTMTFAAAPPGFVSGSYNDGLNKPRAFRGVVLQKQNHALGLFRGLHQTGGVELK